MRQLPRINYKNLGSTGLKVSELCLGCMTYGVPERGDEPSTLPEERAARFCASGWRSAVIYFDTANAYSDGTSEEIVGRALKDFTRRDEVVHRHQGLFPHDPRARTAAASRARPYSRRLTTACAGWGTDHVDLYQIRRLDYFHPDRRNPRGPARRRKNRQGPLYRRLLDARLAIQQGPASRTAHTAGRPFVSMQNHYNLLYREEEREMMPAVCRRTHRRHSVEPPRPWPADSRMGYQNRSDSNRRVWQ